MAKTNVPDQEFIQPILSDLTEKLSRIDTAKVLEREPYEEEIRQFFHEQTFAEILTTRRYLLDRLQMTSSALDRAALAFVGTCVAHILHGNRPYALSRRSHNIIPIPPKGEFQYKSLLVSLRKKLVSMYKEPLPPEYTPGQAYHGSVLNLPFEANSIDTVITSPPFLGTTDFLRHNRVRLWFCGWDYAYQAQQKTSGQFFEYVRTCDPYVNVLRELARVLKPQSLLIMHLGVVKKLDMAVEIERLALERNLFESMGIVYEDATNLESHGRVDRGSTHHHAFLFLRKR
ncbi:hypothetical protein [Planifilum fimeticola]|uniref:hypothetical protein n=1 Tax=Planifilum fimeticola TaxID=201975 RepID=UPI001FE6FC28|nr:hypothetical protein [Planifilum fimeticola]